MIQFQHTAYLFALTGIIPMAALYMWVVKWKQSRIKKIGDPALVNQLIKEYSPKKFLLKFIFISLAFAIAVIALANPRTAQGVSKVKRNGIDVMIALDVSKSMLAQDIKPNRLERARQFIGKLIDKLPEDRIGLVVFAGRAYLQMPLTSDHAAAKMYLSSASPDVVPTQGTVIGDALKMCYAAFNTKEKKYKSIVLISDGEDHDETADKITTSLADEGVMVNTVGIGSPEGTTIEDPVTGEIKKDAGGNMVITKLNEAGLKSIATKGNGLYQLFTSADEVANAVDGQLKTIGQHSITETSLLNYHHYFPLLLGIVLILLLAEFFMSEKKSSAITNRIKPVNIKGRFEFTNPAKTLLLFITVIALLPATGMAQTDKELIKSGNEAYNKKQFDAAAENYKKATEKNSSGETAQYNLGNALYKTGKKEEAQKAYDAAIANSKKNSNKSEAWYNKGVIAQNEKKWAESINAYKNALKLNPKDEDARLNLQKAIQKKKEQEQKEKKEQQKKQDKKQDQPQKPKEDKPQPSKMTKKEAEEKLKALLQQEKNLQDKLRKVDQSSPNKPEKDW